MNYDYSRGFYKMVLDPETVRWFFPDCKMLR